MPPLLTTDAIQSAAYERLRDKSDHIIDTLRHLDGDLAHTCIVALARALGFGVNSQPFEQTAMRLNLNYCARHADDLMQLDAIVIGTAGLLSKPPANPDAYFYTLQSEYDFLSHKYDLRTLPREIWKSSGFRPQSSPYRRLAYLARILPKAGDIVGLLTQGKIDTETLTGLLNLRFDGFWANHYTLGAPSPRVSADALSDNSLRLIFINAIAPLAFALGRLQGNVELEDAATDLLVSLPPEQNTLIRDWQRVGIKPRDAFDTQGLIQLRKQYCDCNKCLRCRIGNRLMRSHALPSLPVK